MMIGSGIPNNHNSVPLPNPMTNLRLFNKQFARAAYLSGAP